MIELGNSTAVLQLFPYLTLVSSTMSILGSVCIIVSFIFPVKRSVSRYIVLVMALSDLAMSVPAFINSTMRLDSGIDNGVKWNHSVEHCKIESFLMTTGAMTTFIWTAGLAQHMYLLVTSGLKAAKKALVGLVILTVLVIALNVYCYYQNILGMSHEFSIQWCWINTTSPGNCKWMVLDGKGLEITSYVVVFVYYILLYQRLHEIQVTDDSTYSSVAVNVVIAKTGKIIAIPIIFVLIRLPGTICTLMYVGNACQEITSKPPLNTFLFFGTLQSFFDLSQGWVNCILFSLTTPTHWDILAYLKLRWFHLLIRGKIVREQVSENSYRTVNSSRIIGRSSRDVSSGIYSPTPRGSRDLSPGSVLSRVSPVSSRSPKISPGLEPATIHCSAGLYATSRRPSSTPLPLIVDLDGP